MYIQRIYIHSAFIHLIITAAIIGIKKFSYVVLLRKATFSQFSTTLCITEPKFGILSVLFVSCINCFFDILLIFFDFYLSRSGDLIVDKITSTVYLGFVPPINQNLYILTNTKSKFAVDLFIYL